MGRMWLDDLEQQREESRDLIFRNESTRYHEVLAGLAEGERVVTSGNFLLSSESQLRGALGKILGTFTTEFPVL